MIAPHVDRFKVASWGATDHLFLDAHCRYRKPLVISTGVDDASHARYLRNPGGFHSAWLLHCVSAYPAPLDELNLAAIREVPLDGLSDHSRRIMTGAFAVCAGARILEVHFCLPETAADHPDRCVSHEPDALKEYVRLARMAGHAMGDGVKRIMPSERENVRHRYV